MNPWEHLMEKPWMVSTNADTMTLPSANVTATNAARTALGFLLAVISVVFFLLILTLLSRSQFPDFEALAGAPWQPLTDARALWINTFFLAAASITLQYSSWQSRSQVRIKTKLSLFLAAIFTCAFIFGQFWLWQRLVDLGYFVASNPANSYFFLLTGAHAAHLVGGLIALFYVALPRQLGSETANVSIRLCTRYWHFLFGLWLLLFWLLTASADTYKTIAQLCGL